MASSSQGRSPSMPLPSLARPSLSHRFPMGASHSASAITVGHLVMVGLGRGLKFGGGSYLVFVMVVVL